jgi:hypothetical protein
MHKQIIAIVFAILLISFSAEASYTADAEASYTAEVGYITPSEYEGVEKLGENLTDAVACFDQVESTEVALLQRRWGRLTRKFGYFHLSWVAPMNGDQSLDPMNIADLVEPMNGNQIKPFEEALLYRRWGRLTRRWRGSWPSS